MIKVSIMYPNVEGSKFDIQYYADVHMPMSINLVKDHPGFRGVSVEHGISGVDPAVRPDYVAMCDYLFNSVEDFWDATNPHGETLQRDMLHCTDITPHIQISEVLIFQ